MQLQPEGRRTASAAHGTGGRDGGGQAARMSTSKRRGGKSTQRARILEGMIAAANQDGYRGASVSAVIGHAGVSRPTFYEYFKDRDDCFRVALSEVQRGLVAQIRRTIGRAAAEQALHSSVESILTFCAEQPSEAYFLMGQPMRAGKRAFGIRDRGLLEIETLIGQAGTHAASGAASSGLPPRLLVGGIYRLLYPRLRRGQPNLYALGPELRDWCATYEQPGGQQPWQPAEPNGAVRIQAQHPAPAPPRLVRGRRGRSKSEIAENHRERILHAAAVLAQRKGYDATTIADITRLAGVDGRSFYNAFADKQHAFMALHERGVQQVMNATAQAFFNGKSWPERIWSAGQALTEFLEQNPLITHVGFVEAHAVGPGAIQRVEDSHVAFAIFLQEGYRHPKLREPPPTQLALEAIIATIFETIYQAARATPRPQLTRLLPLLAYTALAPFLGAQEADTFIAQRLKQGARAPRPPRVSL